MPFLLRRTKDEVLADLPPKIIQDRYCDLSPLQLRLYEDFSRSQAKKEVSSLVQAYGGPEVTEASSGSGGASAHVFQVLSQNFPLMSFAVQCNILLSIQVPEDLFLNGEICLYISGIAVFAKAVQPPSPGRKRDVQRDCRSIPGRNCFKQW